MLCRFADNVVKKLKGRLWNWGLNMTRNFLDDRTLAIETKDLNYKYASSSKTGLEKVSLEIPWGSTNLLVGPNGAGKSTLLRILAGKSLIKKGSLKLGGFDPFEFSPERHIQHNSDINNFITYLGTEWAASSVVKRDIPVLELIASVGGNVFTDRRDNLINILDIDPEWSMTKISDGERRRVQICMGLLKPWRLLLLDEVTIDLDVVVRLQLLLFLKNECVERNCCVVYATHIFDGLGKQWCNTVYHINNGEIHDKKSQNDIKFTDTEGVYIDKSTSEIRIPLAESLHPLALHWLRNDLLKRGTRQEEKERLSQR